MSIRHRALFRPRPTAVALAAAGLAAAGCATGTPPGYEEAARAARLNARSPAHSLYHDAVERRFRFPLERAARECSMTIPDKRGVRILYRLDAEGAPAEIILHPDAAFGECVLGEIRAVEVPAPPEPDYWIRLDVAGASRH